MNGCCRKANYGKQSHLTNLQAKHCSNLPWPNSRRPLLFVKLLNQSSTARARDQQVLNFIVNCAFIFTNKNKQTENKQNKQMWDTSRWNSSLDCRPFPCLIFYNMWTLSSVKMLTFIALFVCSFLRECARACLCVCVCVSVCVLVCVCVC